MIPILTKIFTKWKIQILLSTPNSLLQSSIELIVFAFEIEIHNFFRYLQKTSNYYDWDTITIILFYWIVGNQTLNFKGIVY